MLSLTELDPDTREPEPELATIWVSSQGGAVVQEADDDGLPRIVNAHDIVYAVRRTCDSRTVFDVACPRGEGLSLLLFEE